MSLWYRSTLDGETFTPDEYPDESAVFYYTCVKAPPTTGQSTITVKSWGDGMRQDAAKAITLTSPPSVTVYLECE